MGKYAFVFERENETMSFSCSSDCSSLVTETLVTYVVKFNQKCIFNKVMKRIK